jgi:hypothetical protein
MGMALPVVNQVEGNWRVRVQLRNGREQEYRCVDERQALYLAAMFALEAASAQNDG